MADAKGFVSLYSGYGQAFEHNAKLHFRWYDQLIFEAGSCVGQHNRLVFDTKRWDGFIAQLTKGEHLNVSNRRALNDVLIPLATIDGGAIAQLGKRAVKVIRDGTTMARRDIIIPSHATLTNTLTMRC